MMPFVPFVRVKNVDEAIELAIESRAWLSPHGDHPLAGIWTRSPNSAAWRQRRSSSPTAPCVAGLGAAAGEGYRQLQHCHAHG